MTTDQQSEHAPLPPLSEMIADLLGVQISNFGYPVGMGIPPSREHLEQIAGWVEKLVTKYPEHAAVNERPALLARIKRLEEALRHAERYIKDIKRGPHETEALRVIRAALAE